MSKSNGLQNWLIQRISAVWMSAIIVYYMYFFITHPELNFSHWHDLFSHPVMKIATVITVLSLAMHAWIGMWTVLTDYVQKACIRLFISSVIVFALLGYVVWTIMILWGI